MGKVKLTQEQAEVIKEMKSSRWCTFNSIINQHISGWRNEKKKCLNKLSLEDLATALLIGYEIEPEYKKGEWVSCLYISGLKTARIERIEGDKVYARWEDGRLDWNYIYDIRHVTPEEIKAEQERRVWKKIGREPGEFQDGDLGKFKYSSEVTRSAEVLSDWYSKGNVTGFFPAESFISFGGDSHD